jgi:hypothetical protein
MNGIILPTGLLERAAVLNKNCVQSVNFGRVDIYRRAFWYDVETRDWFAHSYDEQF